VKGRKIIDYHHSGITSGALRNERTGSFQYVVDDAATKIAAISASVLNFKPCTGTSGNDNVAPILDYVPEGA
jgi:hypothetical protein